MSLPADAHLRRPYRLAALLLAAAAVVGHGKAWFTGRVLSGADYLYALAPWSLEYPGRVPSNGLILDEPTQFAPWMDYAAQRIRSGEIPLWNSRNSCGAPFLANFQSAVLYPPNVLYYLFPTPWTWTLILTLKVWLAGFGMFVLLRRMNASFRGALFGGITYMFGGFMTVWIYSLAGAAALLPWVAWLAIRAGGSGRGGDGALLGAALAVTVCSGHPETAFRVCLTGGLFFLAACRGTVRPLGALLRAGLPALAVGVLCSAPQWLPFLEYASHSAAWRLRASGALAAGWPLLPALLKPVFLVFPKAFGMPLGGAENYMGAFLGLPNYAEAAGGFFGILGLVAAAAAVAQGWRIPWLRFCAVLGGLGLLFSLSLRPVDWLLHLLPGVGITSSVRFVHWVSFFGACLAGLGLETLLASSESTSRRLRNLGMGLLVLAAAGWGTLAGIEDYALPLLRGRAERLYSADSAGRGHAHPLEYWIEKVPEYYQRCKTILVVELALAALWILAAALAMRWDRAGRAGAGALFLVAALAEMVRFSSDYMPAIPPARAPPRLAALDVLPSAPGGPRVHPLGGFPPNTNLPYGLTFTAGYDAVDVVWYWDYLLALDPSGFGGDVAPSSMGLLRRPLLDAASAEFILSSGEIQGPGLAQVESGPLRVYRNTQARPRAYLSATTRSWNPGDGWPVDFDPARETLIEGEVPPGGSGAAAEGSVEIEEYAEERVVLRARTNAPSLLVLTDTWFPGWEASVDRRPVEILRANGAFRAVPVGAGESRVEFRYRPRSWRWGCGMALSGGILLCLFAVLSAANGRSAVTAR